MGPLDSRSGRDPVEQVYDHRIRGVGVIMVQAERRMHAHAGCWFMLASVAPPTLMVAIPQEFAASTLIPESGRFTVSLVSEDQMRVVDQFFAGVATPEDFLPGTLVTAPSGQPSLGGSLGIFDCAVAGRWDLGDFLLVAGAVQAAGAERPGVSNLTVNAIQARADAPAKMVLPRRALPAPLLAPPAVALDESAAAVYARRRFGPVLVVAGFTGAVAERVTRAVVQVSHDPPRFLWAVPEADTLAVALTAGGGWSLALMEGDAGRDQPGRWVEGVGSVRWVEGEPMADGSRPYFAGVRPERLKAPTMPHDALWLGRVEHFGRGRGDRSSLRAAAGQSR